MKLSKLDLRVGSDIISSKELLEFYYRVEDPLPKEVKELLRRAAITIDGLNSQLSDPRWELIPDRTDK